MEFESFNWTCPYCNRDQAVAENKFSQSIRPLGIFGNTEGVLGLQHIAVGCASANCGKTTVHIVVRSAEYIASIGDYKFKSAPSIFNQRILPAGLAKPQPDFIPASIREDYFEASLICDMSPKASATLVRRCLQGMIRDFTGIIKSTLNQEIKALRAAVEDGSADRSITIETVNAIDHVRGVGNIGAHMEKDIDLIVPVDPGEAQALIVLVEMLFEEWYVARETRQQRFAKIAKIAEDKQAAKDGAA
jgi:Domain of unknown function (DUF4145)